MPDDLDETLIAFRLIFFYDLPQFFPGGAADRGSVTGEENDGRRGVAVLIRVSGRRWAWRRRNGIHIGNNVATHGFRTTHSIRTGSLRVTMPVSRGGGRPAIRRLVIRVERIRPLVLMYESGRNELGDARVERRR